MKYRELAAAIRRGAKMASEGDLLVTRKNGGKYCPTCAVGAALISFGYERDVCRHTDAIRELQKFIPGITEDIIRQASTKHYRGMGGRGPRMTREQIADWLDSLEPIAAGQASPSVAPAAHVGPVLAASRISDEVYTQRFIESVTGVTVE